ncbi:MAG: DUF192 domain-containing protein [Alphaproteobacteria bacterium]|nr:DUF192 domain-containing protein [Alphaproteobacteria bacterium]
MSKQIIKWTSSLVLALSILLIAGGLYVAAADLRAQIMVSKQELIIINATKQRHAFTVDMAITAEQQQKGLMYRENLADDYGMLFVNNGLRDVTMWMKNTPSPLDMLFIANDGKILWIAENTKPYDERTISSHFPVRATLEIKGGQVAARGIKLGDTVYSSVFGNAPPH